MKPIKDLSLRKCGVEQLSSCGGFACKELAEASKILRLMLKDEQCLRFLSFPACIVASGCRGLIAQALQRKWFDLVITPCGSLDHDIARCFGNYYEGSFDSNDVELLKRGLHRIGSVLVPSKLYGKVLEQKLQAWLTGLYRQSKHWSGHELCWEIGKKLKKSSFLYWCWKHRIPVIVPGILDGAVGYQLWLFWQKHKDFQLDLFVDEQLLSDAVWKAKRTGALILGGGISKHHVLWWNQFHGGLDYAIYVTTASEYNGSLSGARTKEAISWRKIKSRAKHVTVHADATLVLPFLFNSV